MMKKLALLLSMALLAACGGGGSSGSNGTTQSSQAISGQTATVNVSFGTAKSTFKMYSGTRTPFAKEMVRIVVTNPTVPALANVRYTIADFEVGTTPPSLQIPIANGYVFEGIRYLVSGTSFSNYTAVQRRYDWVSNSYKNYSTPMPAVTTTVSPYTLTAYGKLANTPIVSGTNNILIPVIGYSNPVYNAPAAASITGYADATAVIPTYSSSATIDANGPYATNYWTFKGGYTSEGATNGAILQTVLTGTALPQNGPLALQPNGTPYTEYWLCAQFYIKSVLRKDTDPVGAFTYLTTPVKKNLTIGMGTISGY